MQSGEDYDVAFVNAMLQRHYTLDYILGLSRYERMLHMGSILCECAEDKTKDGGKDG